MKEKFKILFGDKNTKLLMLALMVSGVLIFISSFADNEHKNPLNTEDSATDTVIPRGYVLVPIEIQNFESLSSLVGRFAVVDLFTTPQIHQKSGLCVGRRLRLLRAPLNPQQFAVLVPEDKAHQILEHSGPFTAVLQNPRQNSESEIISRPRSAPVVEYLKGASHAK